MRDYKVSGIIPVTNIVRYTCDDGAGLRTTVFLQGCRLHCPWCANPETISHSNQIWFDEEACVGSKNGCILNKNCSRSIAEKLRGRSEDYLVSCPVNALSQVSKTYTTEELERVILLDRSFWGEGGGVTFSGGEAVLHMGVLEGLLKMLKDQDINIVFETSGVAPVKSFNKMLSYADFVYMDIKILSDEAEKVIGFERDIFLTNLRTLDASGIDYVLRLPLIKPYTCNRENMERIVEAIASLHTKKVEIFACHDLGDVKAKRLGIERCTVSGVDEATICECKNMLSAAGIEVKVLRL